MRSAEGFAPGHRRGCPCGGCAEARGYAAPRVEKKWSVYFIRAGASGPVKVGRAVDVAKRRTELQHGNHEQLTIIGVVPIDSDSESRSKQIESELHERLAALWLRGEWFSLTPEVLALVQELGGACG